MKPNQTDFLVRYALSTFAVILIAGVLLRTFVISSYAVSGMNMLPSVWPGDFLAGVKWGATSPHRGEVVVLRCPADRDQNCLRRVVGVAGDRVEFQDGVLTINGERAGQKTLADSVVQESVAGESWLIWPSDGPSATTEAMVVPPNHLYLLNDKRSFGEDSRSWGPIKSDLVEASIRRVWLSLDWFEGDQIRSFPRVRWERMLRSIN